jgi:hypothetical protein
MTTLRLTVAAILAAAAFTTAVAGQVRKGQQSITIKVLVPPDAKVEFDGSPTQQDGKLLVESRLAPV